MHVRQQIRLFPSLLKLCATLVTLLLQVLVLLHCAALWHSLPAGEFAFGCWDSDCAPSVTPLWHLNC